MSYDLVRFRNKLKAYILEFSICYLNSIRSVDEISDESFIVKREIVYAPSKSEAIIKLRELYMNYAVVQNFRILKVCNIK